MRDRDEYQARCPVNFVRPWATNPPPTTETAVSYRGIGGRSTSMRLSDPNVSIVVSQMRGLEKLGSF
ncbi:hypothetical protein RBSWK_02720 [Rhodopirellula baltica SWK14]|uniref:Uncharacterized protein n=1 Tax=Rhodopirellula baltica SWK14 TaxID=993516 RepID=L7CJT1_RHOBT|nr:hypothetical protein RBSWK_02720 [Rhodopirellula baltica SWK14]